MKNSYEAQLPALFIDWAHDEISAKEDEMKYAVPDSSKAVELQAVISYLRGVIDRVSGDAKGS